MQVRKAKSDDIPAMAHIAELRRLRYQEYEPVFWKKAINSEEIGRDFYHQIIKDQSTCMFVADGENGVTGFLIARQTQSPPVYDPGGITCVIDDFAVADPALWSDHGKVLLEHIQQYAKNNNWKQLVIVCGDQDTFKKTMLEEAGLRIASNWYTHALD